MNAVDPILSPDPEAMRRQLEHVFLGDLDGAHEGLIELAWNDERTGALSAAELFSTDRIDDLVERAANLNRTPGVNVYVGAALRKPLTRQARRSTDADFLAASCLWADVDSDVVAPAIASCKRRGVPPTMTVVTGRHPHLRAQMWWRLDVPARDPAALRALCANVAAALGGDPSVVNPGRVLRLGGSVAWPTKDGRVLERTEVHIPDDGRPREYFFEQLGRAFAPEPGPLAQARSQAETQAPIPPVSAPPRHDGGLAIGSLSVEAAVEAVRRGDRWHDHVVRLVAHWLARGWSDAEILATAESLTLPGWTHDQTRRDLARMIEGGRRKWNIPNPLHEVGDSDPPPPLDIAWVDRLNPALIPRRRWLIGSFAIRGHVTVLVAPPGAGKSTLGIALATAAATGRDELVGETVHEPVKAWVWNNEDDQDELRRRLAAVMQRWGVDLDAIRHRLGLNSGADRPLLVARAGRDGAVARLPDIDAIAERVRANGVGLLVVDPFVETHEVDENDNAQIKAVAVMWREVARRCDCAVVLVHHTGKPPAAAPDAWAGSLSASRGASSLAGVARIVRTLFGMSERDADKLGLAPEERHRWVRLDDAKANLSLSESAKWFRRESVTIANGDEVGVLVPGDPKPETSSADFDAIRDALLNAIGRAWDAGDPLSQRPQARERYAPAKVARDIGATVTDVETVLIRLMSAGVVREEVFNSNTKKRGLRIVPFDEREPPPGEEGE
jgi:hypothetical protein